MSEIDDFQPGEDVTDSFEEPRRPSGIVVSVRLAPQDADRLIDLAEETGRTVSQIARQAIRSFLAFGDRSVEIREVTVASSPEVGMLTVRTEWAGVPTHNLPAFAQQDSASGDLALAVAN
jgi:hypothetical protein